MTHNEMVSGILGMQRTEHETAKDEAYDMTRCQFVLNNVRCGLWKGHKGGHVSIEVVHATALSAIQQLMDGKEWSPDTLDDIALVLEQAGFQVSQPK